MILTIILSIIFSFLLCFIVAIFTLAIMDFTDIISANKQYKIQKLVEPFVLSEYFERTEKAFIDTLQKRNHIDRTIVLWYGLDGLRMNEDGTFEWISREKPKTANQNTFYQMCQSTPILFDGLQNTQASQEQIFALKMQLDIANFNTAMQQQMQRINSALQSYMVPMHGYIGYSPYLQSVALSSSLSQCCCNLYK